MLFITVQFNKLMSVFHASDLLLTMNFLLTLLKSPCGSTDYFDNVVAKFIVNNKTDA